jgi:hypothetical protein
MARRVRQVNTTVLIACEGSAEENFLKHIRTTFLHRNGGIALTIKNAHGKGARYVLDKAIAWCGRGGYDKVAIAYDTDVDLSAAEKKKAQIKRIVSLPSSPCFEATLLQLLGQTPPATTSACKTTFEKIAGWPAHDPRVLDQAAFGKTNIERLRETIPVLARLLAFIEQPAASTAIAALHANRIDLDGDLKNWRDDGRD